MIKNDRQMGRANGYWTGKEVENTQFRNMETLFILRFSVLGPALAQHIKVPHVFFCEIDSGFGDVKGYQIRTLLQGVEMMLQQSKCVTVEIAAGNQKVINALSNLRMQYPDTLCLLLVVEVPFVEAGGFAIKAAPSTVFKDVAFERGVMTASFDMMQQGFTPWKDYDIDIDGGHLPAEAYGEPAKDAVTA